MNQHKDGRNELSTTQHTVTVAADSRTFPRPPLLTHRHEEASVLKMLSSPTGAPQPTVRHNHISVIKHSSATFEMAV